MVEIIKLISGENIVATRVYDNGDTYQLQQPISVKLELNGQLLMLPWPEFNKEPLFAVEIPRDSVIYIGVAEEIIEDEYNKRIEPPQGTE